MKTKAVAVWRMSARRSMGTVTTGTKAIVNAAYLAPVDTRRQRATNSIELIAAALAMCFSITLVSELEQLGFRAGDSTITSTLTADVMNYGWIISDAHLKVLATVPGAKPSDFISASIKAKLNCPVCRLLNVEIVMDARLRH